MADLINETNEPLPVKICKGIVKQVTAGNRIIVREPAPRNGKIPLEKIVVLQSISCPQPASQKLAPGTKELITIAESRGGWQAREFTRKMLIGKKVKFSVEYDWSANGKDLNQVAGNVWLDHEDPNSDGGLIEKGLQAGWFRIDDAQLRRASEQHKDLVLDAANHERGINNHNCQARSKVNFLAGNAESASESISLVKRNHSKKLKAQVEFVASGSMLKVYLVEQETYLMMQLTGVRCNSLNDKVDTSYANEAKLFVETRLLNRDVEVILDYADPLTKDGGAAPGRITGTVIHPQGNISVLLLEEGLAKCAEWSMRYYTNNGGATELRAAQNKAKQARRRLWKNYVTPTESLGTDAQFNAIVKQIKTTDTLVLKKTENREEITVSLSSIRALNKSDFSESWQKKIASLEAEKKTQKQQFSPVLDMPVNFEAREFLRKKIIGQKVKVNIDYKQEAKVNHQMPDGRIVNFPERLCATVMFGATNIAEALVFRGYVKVITHGGADIQEDRMSSQYDALQNAEVKAQASKKGIYDPKMQLPKILEINTKERAGPFFNQYERSGSVTAVVDYVFGPNRIKCYVPRDNINIMCIIAGLEAPRVGMLRNGVREASEPFALQGMEFTKDKIMQQEVSLKVVGLDKYGSFVAYVYDNHMENISVSLAEAGLAKVHWSASRHSCSQQMEDAQQKAMNARKNIWHDYVEEDEEDEMIQTALAAASISQNNNNNKKLPYTAIISDIKQPDAENKDYSIYLSIQEEAAENNLNQIQPLLAQEMLENPPLAGAFRPKRGDVIAARWPADNAWYRAKVDKVIEKSIRVTFIDYGNSDEFAYLDRVAKLPVTCDSTTFKAQSKVVKLAYVEYPKVDEYHQTVFDALNRDLINAKVQITNKYDARNGPEVVGLEDKEGNDLVKNLIDNGEVLVSERGPREGSTEWSSYNKIQKEAIQSHYGVWRYGDIRDQE